MDLKANALYAGSAQCAADRAGLEAFARLDNHPLFPRTLIDRLGTTTAVVVRLVKTGDHDVLETVESPPLPPPIAWSEAPYPTVRRGRPPPCSWPTVSEHRGRRPLDSPWSGCS